MFKLCKTHFCLFYILIWLFMMNGELNEILIHIQQKEYANALDVINGMRKQTAMTRTLKILCLSELENFVEAEKAFADTQSIFEYFNTVIYKNLNMIEKLRKYVLSDHDLYECCMLQGEYSEAYTHAQKLPGNYRLFSAVLSGKKVSVDDLREAKVNSNMLIFLHRQQVIDINDYLFKIDKFDAQFYILVKEMYTSHTLSEKSMQQVMKLDGIDFVNDEGFLNFLIGKIDDWSLYEVALKQNYKLIKTASSNYKYYRMIRDMDVNAAKEHIYALTDFAKIAKLVKIFAIEGFENDTFDVLYRHLNGLEGEDDIAMMHTKFTADPSFFNAKLFLSMLIASKNESNLLYAYYLINELKSKFAEEWEIRVIHLFLARFFCDYNQVIVILSELDVKNVLLKKMSYIWSDIYIKFHKNENVRRCLSDYAERYYNWNKGTIKQINLIFMRFINDGLLQHASELLETRQKLNNDVLMSELKQEAISDTKDTFKNFLSDKAGYIFEKCTMNMSFDHFHLMNMYKTTCTNIDVNNDVFDTKFENIHCVRFISTLTKLQNDLKQK